MDILEDFEELEREQDKEVYDPSDKKKSRLRKVAIIIGGVILSLLIVSLIVVSYPISDIIKGQLESIPWQGNKIILENFTIIFKGETQRQLSVIYSREQKVEFSACLIGEKREDRYLISSLYLPEQTAVFNHVSFEPCHEDTLIMLHSHPYKSCLASETDLETLRKSKDFNQNMLMVIMCEPDRFSVYG